LKSEHLQLVFFIQVPLYTFSDDLDDNDSDDDDDSLYTFSDGVDENDGNDDYNWTDQ